MDDLAGKIQNILQDEESMKQISELAAMLGLSSDSPAQNESSGTAAGSANGSSVASNAAQPPFGGMNQFSGMGASTGAGAPTNLGNALSQLLGGGGSQQSSAPESGDLFGSLDIAKLASLAGALKNSGSDDENIRFILALKPLLSAKKQARADSAIKILRLLNLIPLIKASGII